jgi:hypothetical protein
MDDADGPVFITGLDRSGKTPLRRALGAHPDLHLVRRVSLWTRDDDRYGDLSSEAELATCLAWLRSDRRTAVMASRAGSWLEAFHRKPRTAAGLFASLYAADAAGFGKNRWGEQDAEIELHAARLLRMLPTARVLHLVRDPRSRYAAVVAGDGRRAGRLGSTTASWVASVRRGTAAAARYPRQYRVVRAEDLDDRPDPALEGIHEFLGLRLVPETLEGWSAGAPTLAELRRTEVTFIEAWAGQAMRRVGYTPVRRGRHPAGWNPIEIVGFAARALREARRSRSDAGR